MTEQTDGQVRRKATAAWLHAQGLRNPEEVSAEEFAELRTLLAPHKGFGILWSMLAYGRQNAAMMLNNVNLATPQGISAASQLQGTIKAIDDFRELVLNIADPLGESSTSPQPQRAGEFVNG
jgi:hypothetical protein